MLLCLKDCDDGHSEDGKCYTAGRELPAIIPLTNNRDTLDDFFASKSIGGTTPGHLGTAWAWYMLSPKWSSIWPAVSTPAEYGDETVMKAAIIMTDGEYNKQYSDATSRNQALALCQGMRDAGITVYTIGFGFSSSSADTTAANMLKQCVNNDSNSYFFPYDATELREAFADIGRRLTGQASKLVVMK